MQRERERLFSDKLYESNINRILHSVETAVLSLYAHYTNMFTDLRFTRVQGVQSTIHHTLPETNIAPENGWLEYYFPFGWPIFRGYVSFREGFINLHSTCVLTPVFAASTGQFST